MSVAQLVRASVCEAEGRGFNSHRSPQIPAPGAAFRAALGAALERIEANAAGAAAGEDPEHLHQLRVGLRRLRSALQAFRPLLPEKPRKRLVRALRRAMPELGAARDLDVLAARLEAVRAPPALLSAVRRRQTRAQRRVARLLASDEWQELVCRARALRAEDPPEGFIDDLLERAHRKVAKKARDIDWDDASESIPAFLTLVGIPLAYSIADGLALGFMAYPVLKLLTGKGRQIGAMSYVIAGLLIIYFVFVRARLS